MIADAQATDEVLLDTFFANGHSNANENISGGSPFSGSDVSPVRRATETSSTPITKAHN